MTAAEIQAKITWHENEAERYLKLARTTLRDQVMIDVAVQWSAKHQDKANGLRDELRALQTGAQVDVKLEKGTE